MKTKTDIIKMIELALGSQKVYVGNNIYNNVVGVGSYPLNVGEQLYH